MKRLLLATTAVMFGAQAFAADLRLPVKAPPAPPPVYSWTGCSVGAHIGVGWGHTKLTDPQGFILAVPGEELSFDQRHGGLAGVQAGCDYQFAGNWVVGAAGDFSWANISSSAADPDPFFSNKSVSTKTDWVASATARFGYAFDRVLIYGRGGAAWAHDKYGAQGLLATGTPFNTCTPSTAPSIVLCNPTGSDTRVGWTVGLGLEWAFWDHWSAGLQFDHYQFGAHTVMLTDPNVQPPSNPSAPFSIKQTIDTAKITFNYRFGWH